MLTLKKIALGGGCHWCTEAVFQSLKGVHRVEQGFVASKGIHTSFSEAVIVHFNPETISLKDLIAIHLHTHESTTQHALRNKYRSAVYFFNQKDEMNIVEILSELQLGFDKTLITKVLPLKTFKASDEQFHNYYFSNKEKPFCKTYIAPKLKKLLDEFSGRVIKEIVPDGVN